MPFNNKVTFLFSIFCSSSRSDLASLRRFMVIYSGRYFFIRGDTPDSLSGLFLLPFGRSPHQIPQGWTLSIEIAFSICIPMLIKSRWINKQSIMLFLLQISFFPAGNVVLYFTFYTWAIYISLFPKSRT
jgi:peptidoglycan/LPS O-acetylase OafA/YrhL